MGLMLRAVLTPLGLGVGLVVGVTLVDQVLLASAPSLLRLPAASEKLSLAGLTLAVVLAEMPGVAVKVAV